MPNAMVHVWLPTLHWLSEICATCTWQAFFLFKHPQLINDDTYQECRGVATACQAEDAGLGPFTQTTPFQSGWRSSQAVNHFIATAVVPLNPRLLQMRPPPWCDCWQQHQRFALGEATLINERLKKSVLLSAIICQWLIIFTASDYKMGPDATAVSLLNFYPSKSRKTLKSCLHLSPLILFLLEYVSFFPESRQRAVHHPL